MTSPPQIIPITAAGIKTNPTIRVKHVLLFIISSILIININKLKADRPHPRNHPHTPTDYRQPDKHLRLIMTLIALCCTRQTGELGQTGKWTDGRTLPIL